VDLWHVVGLVALVGGAALISSIAGFGFGLLLAPPLALLIGPKDTVVLSNLLSSFLNAAMFVRLHAHIEWKLGLVLTAGSMVGMPIGVLVLIWLNPKELQILIALSVVVFAVFLLRGLKIHGGGLLGDAATGIVSGVLNTSTSMSGPPVVLYLQGRGIAPDVFRGTLAALFCVTSFTAFGLLAGAGRFDTEIGQEALFALPALAAGWVGGTALYRHVDEVRFRRLVFAVLFASAAIAVAAALLR
jgi:uncharacterized protein